MKAVLTAEEYRRTDQAYEGNLAEAMDRAGYGVALAAARLGATYGRKVVVLVGPGNNGGDGYVAARYLKLRGAHVEVQALAPPRTAEGIHAANRARSCGVGVIPIAAPGKADLVIDALFGGGARQGFPAEARQWMGTRAPVIAVDYPTGLDPDTGSVSDQAFHAVETVTFSTLKTAHLLGDGPDYCGRLKVVDIGINGGRRSMQLAEEGDAVRPPRMRVNHKWSAGSVLIVGGSTGIVGASLLAGSGALSYGAGSVAVASPMHDLAHQMAAHLPTYDLQRAESVLDRFDVVVAGPGLAAEDRDAAKPVLQKARRIVLDAGGLHPELLEIARAGDSEVVITPHDAEFKRVSGLSAGTYSTRAFATRYGITVLRKGNPTMITDGCPQILINTGGPELATIGTGDVLAGMLGALWARGLGPTEAAVSAAYWHGIAGGKLAREMTVTAPVLANTISEFAW